MNVFLPLNATQCLLLPTCQIAHMFSWDVGTLPAGAYMRVAGSGLEWLAMGNGL